MPLQLVLPTTAAVVAQCSHVSIDDKGMDDLCRNNLPSHLPTPEEFDTTMHYVDTNNDPQGTIQYLLLVDSLNFCFWPCPGLEYEHLARGLKQAVAADPQLLSAARLAALTIDELASWFAYQNIDGVPVPQLEERLRLVHEVAAMLLTHYQGQAANLVRAAQHSATTLVNMLTMHCPGFRDHCIYRGRQVFFYKRAQIFVGDVWGAFAGQGLGRFDDIHSVTMFADYRVPVVLRQHGVLQYSDALAQMVDSGTEICAGTEEEVEIRACTIQAVERIKRHLGQRLGEHTSNEGPHVHPAITSVQVDWCLWEVGEAQRDKGPLHHKTRTVYY